MKGHVITSFFQECAYKEKKKEIERREKEREERRALPKTFSGLQDKTSLSSVSEARSALTAEEESAINDIIEGSAINDIMIQNTNVF